MRAKRSDNHKPPFRRKPPRFKTKSGKRQSSAEPPALKVHTEAQRLLSEIGTPELTPFVPDPFQKEAVERILKEDVLVVAPTGSGKTWIALEATKEYLKRGSRIWYATPLKALSNAKYEEFGEALGRENVGILTGDRKENHDAPVIVGTTEILRNQLYDGMEAGQDLPLQLIVLDEAHYLGDMDRGVVWEEVLIYTPGRIRLLLLSATVSNASEVAQWLVHIRGTRCVVVQSEGRPVPLHALFRTYQGEVWPFFQGKRLFPKMWTYVKADKRARRRADVQQAGMNDLIETLRECNLLPAIFFLKSRSECDRAVQGLLPSPQSPEDDGFESALREQVEPFPELKNESRLQLLLTTRAGSHHAGQLPGWRLLIERMMSLGHLEAIFSTSTVAAGVNFPARTVVLLQSDRFNGQTFVDMTATDLHQMTGRAGRRGMDNAGFILVVPGRHQDVGLVKELLHSPPEPLQSRIAVNFSMVLNLLLSHDPDGVKELLGYSFASFHQNPRQAMKVHRKLLQHFQQHLEILQELEYVDKSGVPTYDGKWAARLRLDHPLVIAELIRRDVLRDLNPQYLAALIAPFGTDKDKQYQVSPELWDKTRSLWKKLRHAAQELTPLMKFLIERGFEAPPIMFWPSAAVFLWAEEVEWDELTQHLSADEGDMAMLILRTADHLRQFLSLGAEQPELAATAAKALQLLMRKPLI